jgi:ADP-heptose:LPS heptosyltransferase
VLLADPAVRSVAIVRLRVGLGDLLCGVPALRALRRARPDLHVTLVTWAEMAPVVDRARAHVDRLLPFPGYPGIPERPVDAAGWEPFLREAGRFDVAVQAYGDNVAANDVCARLDAGTVAGFWPTAAPGEPPAWHLGYPRDLHEVERHLRLMALLGVPVGDDPAERALEFPVLPDDEGADADLRARHGLEPGSYAVLHPGATSPSRRWPPERFAALADALAADGLRVVVTGVPGEREVTAAVLRHARSAPLDLTAATGLGGFALLLRSAALVVANDTGTAHLAAAVGTPSVTVFLAGDPVRWAHDPARHPVARVDVGCNPCPHLVCPIDHRCATRLPVSLVLDHARAALSRRAVPATA